MNKKILDYIKLLTSQDKKSLSQKSTKAQEELGELAKAILAYENATACTHRFIEKEKILEECVDEMLCVLSIIYDQGFNDDEILTMMDRKTNKWAGLLAREGRIKYPIPYEIHVTVEQADLENFKMVCKDTGVKPILLDLHLSNNGVMKDLMTSSVFRGNNREAYEETKRISNALSTAGFKVIREKIETIPWHPAAPCLQNNNMFMPENCYFESHLNVVITNPKKRELLKTIAETHKAKLSNNVFKKLEDGKFTMMVTFRSYDKVYEDFTKDLEKLVLEIKVNDFEIEKEIVEFSIYDTKVSHDASWINR